MEGINHTIHIGLNDKLKEKLKMKAEQRGLCLSTYCRFEILRSLEESV